MAHHESCEPLLQDRFGRSIEDLSLSTNATRLERHAQTLRQAGVSRLNVSLEIDAMVDFCLRRGFILRLIEAMPVGDTGRRAGYLDLLRVMAQTGG